MDSITLAEALELFKLPRMLGKNTRGDEVSANIGRFGPYIKFGDKYISIKDDDPHTITLERALELVTEKQKADAEREIKIFENTGISILNGRYGPYITDGKKNAKIPKDRAPASITLEESRSLLAEAPMRRRRTGRRAGS
jgi:DNA topoisomerase-1